MMVARTLSDQDYTAVLVMLERLSDDQIRGLIKQAQAELNTREVMRERGLKDRENP